MKKFLVANWKSNKNYQGVEQWLTDFIAFFNKADQTAEYQKKLAKTEFILAVPYPFLILVKEAIKASNLAFKLSLQDISPFPAGSYTGAVSVANLEGLNISYTIVGHSERRKYFKESHQDVAKKIELALENKITPILCLDEAYIEEQASALKEKLWKNCLFAYEPLSAIGSGNNADLAKVEEVSSQIKKVYGDVKVIYGGSVDQFNVAEYLLITDGVLVGGASLEAKSFFEIFNKGIQA
ncbi:MAG: triose-phosphate isomerase [Candidatus Woesebacteria bacterium]|jgi:triosephosphate isomerase